MLIVETLGHVLHICLNRPQKRNALNTQTCRDIVSQVQAAQSNEHIGSILFSANGPTFCAGMDLDDTGPELDQLHEALFTMGTWSFKPIVMALDGPALGGGFGLAAQGHVVIASGQAAFRLPELRIGLWPFFIFRSIESAIGPRSTLAATLTGRTITASEAMQLGLVAEICSPAELLPRAHIIATQIANSSPVALKAGMEYVQRSLNLNSADAGALASELRQQVMAGDDFKEGLAAFKEKREPRWPSRR